MVISKMNSFRYYQQEADDAICAELEVSSKCLVKMFCGTGKSLLMAKSKIHESSTLSLFVFPSLALINQFYNDYLVKITSPSNILRVSSDGDGSTTEHDIIAAFLNSELSIKRICVTYQSYKTLVDVMNEYGIVADNSMYDEAHRAIGESYQNNIFHMGDDVHVRKQIFFTATPKNANGIVMYEPTNPESGMCGSLVYDYSYFRGMIEGYLNPFEIRLDFSTDEGVNNTYKSIARTILKTGNNRVLTFHSDVETDREFSVKNFSNHEAFMNAFNEVCATEFADKIGFYESSNIHLVTLSATNSREERTAIIDNLDTSTDNSIYIISSCRTIGEGIDTKRANMCVFVDPKTSYVDIIQNIGRILRKAEGKGCSTVLIPCWVDRSKYEAVQDDPDARDEIIRRDIQENGGNFNIILNVVSAVKQEDEDLYDACLHYPNKFSPKEIKHNLESQGYEMQSAVGDGDLVTNLGYVLDKDIDADEYDECETDEEMIQQIAVDNDVCVEIHSDSLEQPVEKYNKDCESGEVVRLFRNKPTEEEMDEDEELSTTYQPIVKKDVSGKEPRKKSSREEGEFREPNRKARVYVNVHNNDDVKVLWKVCGDGLLDGVSQAIEPEVIDMWDDMLEELKAFIDENEKTPSSRNKLGNWMHNQKQNYRKNYKSMSSIHKKQKWEDFCETYKQYLLTYYEKWDIYFEELKQFIDINKILPRKKSTEVKEKKLGLWLSAQKNNYKEKKYSMASVERQEQWEQFVEQYKELLLTDDEIWVNTYENFIQFIENNNRHPSQKSSNGIEKKLGAWASQQKTKYLNKTMKECRIPFWENILEKYKDYLLNDDEIWVENYKNIINFIEMNNKIPSNTSKNTKDKSLASWLSRQKRHYLEKTMTEGRMKMWEDLSKKYKEYLLSDDEKWNNDFEILKEFIIKNKKRPSNKSLDVEEKFIARWLSSQITNYTQKKNSMITIERQEKWEEFMDKYGYLLTLQDKWNNAFQEVKIFIDKNKKRPTKDSTDKREQEIGRWLSTNIKTFNNKTMDKYPERLNLFSEFLEVYNDYLLSGEDLWYRRFEELKEFLDCNKKTPSNKSNDQNEKLLNSWLTDRKRDYKNGKMDKCQIKKWEELRENYKELLLTFDEIWFIKFEELKEYLINNKKSPSNKSKNKEEKTIGGWFSNQKQHYKNKNNSMKSPERQAIWKQLLEDYSHILNATDDDIDDNASISSTSTTTSTTLTKSGKPKKQPAPKKKSMEYTPAPPAPVKKELTEEEKAEKELRRRTRNKSQLSEYHKIYKVMRSDNLHQHFQENPQEFEKYHDCASANETTYEDPSEIPLNKIIDMLDRNRHKKSKTLLDLGCGPVAKIKYHFDADPRYEVLSFDHLAIAEHITACDIAHLPAEIETDSIDFVVLSLAMWGSNCEDYVKEAHRVLETNGILYIGEPTKRWTYGATEIEPTPEPAQRLVDLLERNGFRILERDIKKFCVFKCSKI
jgi:ribosomal RNA-processing protein 8